MSKRLAFFLLLLIAAVCAAPLLALPEPATAAVAEVQPGFFSWDNLWAIVKYGALVCAAIFGLKNIPFFADFFVAYPKLGVIVNAALSLCTALLLCSKMPAHDAPFYMCVLTGLGVFLSAAGIHGVIAKVSPDTSTPAVNPERVDKLRK